MHEEEQRTWTIQELFDDLPLSIRKLGQEAYISEVTLARIRDGRPTNRTTANRLLQYFSKLYGQKYTLRNVTGITVAKPRRPKGSGKVKQEQEQQKEDELPVA